LTWDIVLYTKTEFNDEYLLYESNYMMPHMIGAP